MTIPNDQAIKPEEVVLPCPFCGLSTVDIEPLNHWTGMRSVEIGVTLRHWCPPTDPNGRTPMFTVTTKTRDAALQAWNRRA